MDRSKITKEIIDQVIRYSDINEVPEKEAAEVFGIDGKQFSYYKKKYGIEMNPIGRSKHTYRAKRIYSVDDGFFGSINEITCYYAGFFAADGCVGKNNKTCTIGLCDKDVEWLQEFKKYIKFTGKISKGTSKGKYRYVRMSFNSPQIINDLCEHFNITPAKSLTLKHPNLIDQHMIDSFICGYIDGDGSVCFCNNKKQQNNLRISIVGTLDMCKWVKKRFEEILCEDTAQIHRKDNIYTYSVTNKKARTLFLHYYDVDVPKLARKWSKEKYNFCINFTKQLPVSRRKGVYVYDLNGDMTNYFDTLMEASQHTGVSMGRISNLCKFNDNKHMANGFMFNRSGGEIGKYSAPYCLNKKYYYRESKLVDKGEVEDIEM